MTTPAMFDVGEVARRGSVRMRLRTLLADRRWHRTAELLAVAGSGVSSRVHELRCGADGLPALEVDVQRDARGYLYRVDGETIPGANLDGGRAEAPTRGYRCDAGRDRPCDGIRVAGPACAVAGCPWLTTWGLH